MKPINEETIYDQKSMVNEETIVENEIKSDLPHQESGNIRNRKWIDAGIGAGTGVAAGIIGTLFTSGTIPAKEDLPVNEEETTPTGDGLTTPIVTDGKLSIAHGVSDDMSFNEAFRVAHDEVGPGGVFEWHGQLYGTYTAAEWNNLTSEERLEYNNHLRVVGTPDYASNVSHHESVSHVETSRPDVAAVDVVDRHDGSQGDTVSHDEVAVVSEPISSAEQSDDAEVEVLGVEYVQTESGQEMAVGAMSVNGQQIFVLDADNDGTGDLAAMDVNGNGKIDEDEIMELSDHSVDMSVFGTADSSVCGGVTPEGPDYLAAEGV